MHSKRLMFFLTFMTTVLFFAMSVPASAASVARISTDELNSRLGEKGLLVLDVRSNHDWVGSKDKISGAERVELSNLNQWAENQSREKTIVLYCA